MVRLESQRCAVRQHPPSNAPRSTQPADSHAWEEACQRSFLSALLPKQHMCSRLVSRAKQRVRVRFISHADLLCQGSDPVLVRKQTRCLVPGSVTASHPSGKPVLCTSRARSETGAQHSVIQEPSRSLPRQTPPLPDVLALTHAGVAKPRCKGHKHTCSDALPAFWHGARFTVLERNLQK